MGRSSRSAGGRRTFRRGRSAQSLRNGGARVLVTGVDPICALQAAMESFEVVTMEEAVTRADIFVTATGNMDVITLDHMRAMKNMASRGGSSRTITATEAGSRIRGSAGAAAAGN